eukprot:6132365-Amphidinium_carterae.1
MAMVSVRFESSVLHARSMMFESLVFGVEGSISGLVSAMLAPMIVARSETMVWTSLVVNAWTASRSGRLPMLAGARLAGAARGGLNCLVGWTVSDPRGMLL